jgi:hypothetical protein
MRFNLRLVSMLFLAGVLFNASDAAKRGGDQAAAQQPAVPSLALSPGVIQVKAQPGASSAHVMTLTNLTGAKFRFVLEAFDVVIHEGKRVFIPAGETEGGIARSAVFDPPAIELNPGESGKVKVTLTIPADPKVRAVVAIIHGQTALPGRGTLMVTGSLGTLITYNLSARIDIRAGAPTISPQTDIANLMVSQQLENHGQEPAIPKGTLAVLKSSGELIGRVPIEPHRLLPGEKFNCEVEYPHSLRPGKYRAMVSIQHEGGVQTSSIEFQVPSEHAPNLLPP